MAGHQAAGRGLLRLGLADRAGGLSGHDPLGGEDHRHSQERRRASPAALSGGGHPGGQDLSGEPGAGPGGGDSPDGAGEGQHQHRLHRGLHRHRGAGGAPVRGADSHGALDAASAPDGEASPLGEGGHKAGHRPVPGPDHLPQQQHRPPGHQAGEHLHRQSGQLQAGRLRRGPDHGAHDLRLHPDRDLQLHGPGDLQQHHGLNGHGGGPAGGHLLPGHGAL